MQENRVRVQVDYQDGASVLFLFPRETTASEFLSRISRVGDVQKTIFLPAVPLQKAG